jgi:hypothetical protein
MNFQIEITLPEYGTCMAEFEAFFNYKTAEWDASDPVVVHLEDENEEPLEVGELNVTSQLIVFGHVQEALVNATPSDSEIEAEQEIIRGEHDGDCDRDDS